MASISRSRHLNFFFPFSHILTSFRKQSKERRTPAVGPDIPTYWSMDGCAGLGVGRDGWHVMYIRRVAIYPGKQTDGV
jgi:hypothetical protein